MSAKSLARIALVVILAGCSQAVTSSAPTPSPPVSPSPRTTLTADEQAQLATLEARPLEIPSMPPTEVCPVGPFTASIQPYVSGGKEFQVYGSGPVYGLGGPETRSATNYYYDVRYIADPTVTGVILVRIQELGGAFNGFFVGPYQAGKVVGMDTINGAQTTLYDELGLPIASPSAGTGAATGWKIFKVRQGIDRRYTCVGIQIDTSSGTQVIVASH
jgi:hypothetical protein